MEDLKNFRQIKIFLLLLYHPLNKRTLQTSYIYNHHQCTAQRQVLHCKRRNLGCSSAEGRSSTTNSENQDCSFTRDLIGSTASRCFPHPTLSLASEQTLKDLKRSQGHQRGEWIWLAGPSGFHRNSPQRLNISSIRVFDQIRDPEIPINLRPHIYILYKFGILTSKQQYCYRYIHASLWKLKFLPSKTECNAYEEIP